MVYGGRTAPPTTIHTQTQCSSIRLFYLFYVMFFLALYCKHATPSEETYRFMIAYHTTSNYTIASNIIHCSSSNVETKKKHNIFFESNNNNKTAKNIEIPPFGSAIRLHITPPRVLEK